MTRLQQDFLQQKVLPSLALSSAMCRDRRVYLTAESEQLEEVPRRDKRAPFYQSGAVVNKKRRPQKNPAERTALPGWLKLFLSTSSLQASQN